MAASLHLALQTLLLSSDHVSHKSHKFVGGTGETGWALPTRRVREVRGLMGAGGNARNRHLGVSVGWLVNTAEEAKVLKTRKGYGEGLLWSVSEGVVGRAVPTERRQQKPVYEGIQQPGPRSSSLRHHSAEAECRVGWWRWVAGGWVSCECLLSALSSCAWLGVVQPLRSAGPR